MNLGKSLGLTYGLPTRNAFGEALRELGHENPDIVVVDGDVSNSTRTGYFAKDFPERFFDMGIAESTMIGVASGLAASGKQALAASFSAFLLCNAYEQIRMSIAFPQLNVKLVGSHSGISVGEDGPSQMAIEDIALATALPHFIVLVPADEPSTRAATRAMFEHHGPVYLRTGRPQVPIVYTDGVPFEIGKANRLDDATKTTEQDVTLIACGLMVVAALEAADQLAKEGIRARVLDMHTIKPIDQEAITSAARETSAIVTAEEHLLDGGLGSAVARVVTEQYPVPVAMVGLRNQFAESGESQELLEKYGLMPADIVRAAIQVLDRKRVLWTR